MAVKRQLSVFLENRPGMLGRACSILSENGINILALSVHDTVDHSVVRFYVDNPMKALLLVENEGFYVLEQDIVVLDVENRPGCLSSIAQKLAEADINIDYAYCTATPGQVHGCIVIKTDNPERASELLSDF